MRTKISVLHLKALLALDRVLLCMQHTNISTDIHVKLTLKIHFSTAKTICNAFIAFKRKRFTFESALRTGYSALCIQHTNISTEIHVSWT